MSITQGTQSRTTFVYDGKRRRRVTREETKGSSGQWVLASETRYVYDGMRVIQERNINGVPTVAYTRGPDLSGTLEGAGGIGGLLARSEWDGSAWSRHAFYHSDGVGNVTALAVPNGNAIALAGSYRYDPFGRLIGTPTGLAAINTQRYSSKDWHNASGFYYFGYRFYDPATQRWLNRDPIGELFDQNMYRFVYNNPTKYVDPNGLFGIAFGNSSGSSYFNLGLGDPTFYFGPDSVDDLKQSAAATADGINPFGDPFAKNGVYDPNDPYNQFSHGAGKVGQVCLTSAAGLGALRAANGALMPKNLYHFTSANGAAGIAATGGIQAGSGLYGNGVYLTGFNSATMATIQGAASTEAAIAVSTEGLIMSPTYFPGTYIARGVSILIR